MYKGVIISIKSVLRSIYGGLLLICIVETSIYGVDKSIYDVVITIYRIAGKG